MSVTDDELRVTKQRCEQVATLRVVGGRKMPSETLLIVAGSQSAIDALLPLAQQDVPALLAEVERLKTELANEIKDIAMLVDHCSQAYCWMTNDLIGKANTLPDAVIAVAEGVRTKEIEDAVNDETEALRWDRDAALYEVKRLREVAA